MSALGRYCRTVRHLRPRQILARVARRFRRPSVSAGQRPDAREAVREIAAPVPRPDGWIAANRVRLLGLEKDFGSEIDWASKDMPRLWIYNLHYFSDLPGAAGDPSRWWLKDVVHSWIDSNPAGTADAWDPYPVSLRVVNWIKWLLSLRGRHGAAPEPPLAERILDSLALQVRYLEKRLEFDIMGNHLLANAVALTAAGFFFGAREGDRWLKSGLDLLFREIEEQVLDDGGHFELSPMYHSLVLEGLLDVINIWSASAEAAPDPWREGGGRLRAIADRMLDWLAAMVHPDGGIGFFNDSALGASATYGELRDYARRVGLRAPEPAFKSVHELAATGYVRLASEDGRTLVIFDAGGVGPAYQPGHSHCDTLSLELSRDGKRLLVNSGTSTYEAGAERLRQRRTAAHNTVRIDGAEQSEVWAAHRCGRRAECTFSTAPRGSAEGCHTGFRHLPGRPLHRRTIAVACERVVITDGFDGRGEHLIEWFFHLHPDVDVRATPAGMELLRDGGAVGRLVFPEDTVVDVEHGTWHPEFNAALTNRRVTASWHGALPRSFDVILEW